jgi:anti-anti-sigma factor
MRVERTLGTVLVRLHGEFDVACVERFEEELEGALDDEAQTLILDLRGLGFIDSSGLRMLVMLDRTTSEDALGFTVLCGDGAVRRVLRETGLDGVLPLVGSAGAVPHSDSPI